MKQLLARFRVNVATDLVAGLPSNAPDHNKYGEQVNLSPVYSDNPNSENYSFSQATPAGSLDMTITNPATYGFFVPGKEYFIHIHAVPETPEVEALAYELHEAGREAVNNNLIVRTDVPTKGFIEWNDLTEAAREGRRVQARYLLSRFNIESRI